MMTYGWAILIIVIVAVILYSMGIFNPSSSVSFTSSGFSPFTVSSSSCNSIGYKVAVIAGPIPNNANSLQITKVYVTSATGANVSNSVYTLSSPVTLKSGQSAVIIVPNLACNAVNVKYSFSAILQYTYNVPSIGTQTINTSGTVAGTTIAGKPSNLVSYEPLTITNTQTSATPTPFQQMVNMTSTDPGWSSIATSNFAQNVEFFYYNGSIIPSWLENYTSSGAIWWLKLPAIPSSSSTTVYMGFAPSSTNLFNNISTGEAPQLSGMGDPNLPSNILYSQALYYPATYGFDLVSPFSLNITLHPNIEPQLFASNLDNIAFYYYNGTMIPAHSVSGISNTSANAVFSLYLNQNNSVEAHGVIPPIVVGIANPNTNLSGIYYSFSYTQAGAGIQALDTDVVRNSGIWGKYDNGNKVFSSYAGFDEFEGMWAAQTDMLIAKGYGMTTESVYFLVSYLFDNKLVNSSSFGLYTYTTIGGAQGVSSPVAFGKSLLAPYANGYSPSVGGKYANVTGWSTNSSSGTVFGDVNYYNNSIMNNVTTTRQLNVNFDNNFGFSTNFNLYSLQYSNQRVYYKFDGKLYGATGFNFVPPFYWGYGQYGGTSRLTSYFAFQTNGEPNGVMLPVSFGNTS